MSEEPDFCLGSLLLKCDQNPISIYATRQLYSDLYFVCTYLVMVKHILYLPIAPQVLSSVTSASICFVLIV